MKHLVALSALALLLASVVVVPSASGQNLWVLKSGTLEASKVDTITVDVSKTFDYLGLAMRSDSIANIIVTTEASTRAAGPWYSVALDTLSTATVTGAVMKRDLRTPIVSSLPWGLNVVRFRFAKQASGNGGVTKAYLAVLQGIMIRTKGN